jgi:hypothetical protein
MPFNFSGHAQIFTAKNGVVIDGDNVTVGTDGYTVTSTINSNTVFNSNPTRSATGVWSVQLKDAAVTVMDFDVKTVLASTHYLSTQLLPNTATAGGLTILNWVFNVAGTPTDLPSTGKFRMSIVYADRTT